MVQLAMPQLASDMQSGFLLLSSLLKDMQDQIKSLQVANATSNSEMEKRFGDFLMYGLHLFGRNPATSSSEIALENYNPQVNSTPSGQNDSSDSNINVTRNAAVPTAYTLSRTIVTVTDLWREYTVGLSGCPSVRGLEQQYGTSWRRGKESRFFSRRNEVYQYIIMKANADSITQEEAARRLEERRKSLGVSVDKLRKLLKQETILTSVV